MFVKPNNFRQIGARNLISMEKCDSDARGGHDECHVVGTRVRRVTRLPWIEWLQHGIQLRQDLEKHFYKKCVSHSFVINSRLVATAPGIEPMAKKQRKKKT